MLGDGNYSKEFHCPHCGAPGWVSNGQAQYTCVCRLGSMFAPQPLPLKHGVTYFACEHYPMSAMRETPCDKCHGKTGFDAGTAYTFGLSNSASDG